MLQVLCATDKLCHLHQLFTESILCQTTPPAHVSLLSRDDRQPLSESCAAKQEITQERDLCTSSIGTQESADSSQIALLDPQENTESADMELSTEDTAQSPSIASSEGALSEDGSNTESVGSSPSEADIEAVNTDISMNFDLASPVPPVSVENVNGQEDIPQANSPVVGEGMPGESSTDPSVLSDSIPYNTVSKVCACVCTHACTCVCVCVCVCMHACMYVCVCVCVFMCSFSLQTTGPPMVSWRPGPEEQSPQTGSWHSYSITVSPSTNFQVGMIVVGVL